MGRILRDSAVAIVDLETTGLDPKKHEIIEIAILIIQGGRREMWQTKIAPQNLETASKKALEINGYNRFAWKDAKPLSEVMPAIKKRLRGCVLIGHNLEFDLGFLRAAYASHGGTGMGFHYKVDTMALAYEHLSGIGLNSLSLHNVCRFIGVSNQGEHTAEADVSRCYQVFRKLSRASFASRLWWRLRRA